MLIGLAGVTSTGKTTMATAIKDHFGNKVNIISKISRQEIYRFIQRPWLNPNLCMVETSDRIAFDMGRVNLQFKTEKVHFDSTIPTIVDGCSLLKIAYMIYLSGQYMNAQVLDDFIDDTLAKIDGIFDAIFYLPVERVPFQIADHRVFSSKYVRIAQDAILRNLILKLDPSVKICTFPKQDVNLVFDELYKLGVGK